MLSNLLQELALARDHGRKRIVLDEARLTENPVDRLSRMIKNSFWNALTRRIDGDGLEIICADPKNRTGRIQPRTYAPAREPSPERSLISISASTFSHSRRTIWAFAKSFNTTSGTLTFVMLSLPLQLAPGKSARPHVARPTRHTTLDTTLARPRPRRPPQVRMH